MTPQELIEKYIQDTLTPQEQLEFDILLDADADFKKEVDFHMDLRKVAEAKDDDNFREMLSTIENSPDKKGNIKWWLIAASFIGGIGLAYFFTIGSPPSNEELFAHYFEPYRNITQPVVRSDAQKSLNETAFNAYENAKFKEALDLFDQVLLNKKEAPLLFYKANTLLALDHPKKAIAIFEQNINTVDIFSEKRYWYLALAYLKNNQLEESKKLLKKLLTIPNSEYKKNEAAALLKKLE